MISVGCAYVLLDLWIEWVRMKFYRELEVGCDDMTHCLFNLYSSLLSRFSAIASTCQCCYSIGI